MECFFEEIVDRIDFYFQEQAQWIFRRQGRDKRYFDYRAEVRELDAQGDVTDACPLIFSERGRYGTVPRSDARAVAEQIDAMLDEHSCTSLDVGVALADFDTLGMLEACVALGMSRAEIVSAAFAGSGDGISVADAVAELEKRLHGSMDWWTGWRVYYDASDAEMDGNGWNAVKAHHATAHRFETQAEAQQFADADPDK